VVSVAELSMLDHGSSSSVVLWTALVLVPYYLKRGTAKYRTVVLEGVIRSFFPLPDYELVGD